jgi:Cu/Ag efflux protein CusF
MENDMKKFLTPVVAGAALLAATFAYAADATGAIKAVDAANHTVTLEDNKVYAFPATMDLSKVKVGDKVKITFTAADGKNNATAIANAT